jgi:hypothetical protein
MGTWNNKPYDNDGAADWFAGLMDKSQLREHWLQSLKNCDLDDRPEIARAAVWVFIQLGHVYVWPIENYDHDLKLATSTAEALRNNEELTEAEGMSEALENEYQELLARKK